MIVRRGDATIKIEPNLILRGFIFAPQVRSLSKKAQGMFETAVSMKILVKLNFTEGQIALPWTGSIPETCLILKFSSIARDSTKQTKKAFIVHLISHPRPMVELLNPNFVDTRDIYEKDLKNMVLENVEYEELVETRNRLVQVIINSLTTEDKNFILSVKRGEPAWSLLGLAGVENLPAVKWKILNIKNIHPTKHKKAFEKLRAFLAG